MMSFTITVPATMANLGPGFDCLGLAVAELANTFVFSSSQTYGLTRHPDNAVDWPNWWTLEKSLIHQGVKAVYDAAHQAMPIYMVAMAAQVPLSRGLGSSSTAIVAGCLAANQFLGNPYTLHDLLAMATRLEGHPDNVAPALLGGVQLSALEGGQVDAYSLPWPNDWALIAVIPPYPLPTAKARQAMPNRYPLTAAVSNIASMGQWVHACHTGDADLLHQALAGDCLHQPYRGPLVPLYQPLMAWAAQHKADGVIGGYISGAGSTLGLVVEESARVRCLDTLNDWLISVGQTEVDCCPLTVGGGAHIDLGM